MGLFDFLKGSNPVDKHAARVANKRAQAVDRWESIKKLSNDKTPAAVQALLVRFTYRIDPSITDQEEKDAAFAGVVGAGEVAVEPVCAFLRRADSIAIPLRILEQLVPADRVTDELLRLLADMDTEYERDPERKIQVLSSLEQRQRSEIAAAVLRFLGDMNETARFHAVGALLAQSGLDDAAHQALFDALLKEESVRTRARILGGLAELGDAVPNALRPEVKSKLTDGFAMDPKSGAIRRA
ncbi:MAG: HEAT repeat domain-containing protein [Polyangiales bacterium]|nr:HEAT repeat domain-containing protein [Myxococcales bacterium]